MLSLLGLTLIGGYLYVAIAAARAEIRSGAKYTTAITKAVVWPATIWHTIEKLYFSDPNVKKT